MKTLTTGLRALATAALPVVVLGSLLAAPVSAAPAAAPDGQQQRRGAGDINMRVVTFNTSVDQSFASAMSDLRATFARRPDVVALQEFWSPRRQQAVRDLYTDCADCVYDMYLPVGDGRGSVPIIYRSDRFTLLGARSVPVTEDTYVGPRGAGPSMQAGKYVNHVALFDNVANRTVNVLNNHLVASVQGPGGRPNRRMGPRLKLYRTHMNNLLTMINEITVGAVVVTGDFNVNYRRDRVTRAAIFPYRKLSSVGLEANFGQLREPRTGTHRLRGGNDTRLIDQVWATGGEASFLRAKWQRIMLGLNSDHRPLLVSYRLTAGDETPPPPPEEGAAAGSPRLTLLREEEPSAQRRRSL